jgi:hypothetical protein
MYSPDQRKPGRRVPDPGPRDEHAQRSGHCSGCRERSRNVQRRQRHGVGLCLLRRRDHARPGLLRPDVLPFQPGGQLCPGCLRAVDRSAEGCVAGRGSRRCPGSSTARSPRRPGVDGLLELHRRGGPQPRPGDDWSAGPFTAADGERYRGGYPQVGRGIPARGCCPSLVGGTTSMGTAGMSSSELPAFVALSCKSAGWRSGRSAARAVVL